MGVSATKKYIAEAAGTAILVLFGCGTAVFSGGNIVATALAFGLSIIIAAYTVAKVSGCHVNPAVSFAMYLDGKMSLADFIGYVIGQIVGAIVGAGLVFIMKLTMSSDYMEDHDSIGANGFGEHSTWDISWGGALIAEIVLTLIFVLVVIAVTENKKTAPKAPIYIGVALMFVHLLGIGITGTSVNPARSIGAAIFSGGDALAQLWVFIVAPMVGALLAVLVNRLLVRGSDD